MQQELMEIVQKKYKLLCSLLLILFVSYFLIPLLFALNLDTILYFKVFKQISFIWVYTFLLIPFTWLLGWFYMAIVQNLDKQSEKIIKERKFE